MVYVWVFRKNHDYSFTLSAELSLILIDAMETEKVLHLRKYITLLHAGVRSRIAQSHLHTYNTVCSPRGGYVLRYMPQSVRADPRSENYAATYSKMFSTTLVQPSIDDIEQRLMFLCSDVKKGQISADDLREIIKLCNNETCHSMLLLKCCGNLSLDLDVSERQRLIDQVKHALYFIFEDLILFGILFMQRVIRKMFLI